MSIGGPNPFDRWFAITTSDTVDLPEKPDAIYVGGAGNIVAVMGDNSKATFTGALVGTILPIAPRRIDATNTTATLLLGLKET